MNIDEFEDLIDRHGEDPAHWPPTHRQAAVHLLETSPAARQLVEEARVLRRAMQARDTSAPPGLAERIMARAAESSGADERIDPSSGLADAPLPAIAGRAGRQVRPALLLLLCFASGFAVSMIPRGDSGVQIDVPALLAGIW